MLRALRAALNLLYRTSGLLAGFFLVAIAVLSMAQVGGRLLGFAAHSYDEFAGYCMAASSFLGLSWTFRCNEHIRMTLVIQLTSGAPRRWIGIVALGVGVLLSGYFAWWSLDMVTTSYELNDVSQGLVPVKLWIPQSGMALGLALLVLAIADDLLVTLLGGTPSFEAAERAKASDLPQFER